MQNAEYIVFAKTCSKGGLGGSASVVSMLKHRRCGANPKAILRLTRMFGSDFLSENFIPFINFPTLPDVR